MKFDVRGSGATQQESEVIELDAGEEARRLSRRSLIKKAGGAIMLAGAAGCADPTAVIPSPGPSAGLTEPIHYSSVADLARAIASGRLSSEETVRAHLARIEEVNAALNAVVQLTADAAIARAREADAARSRGESWGPLHGVPMTIKDSFDTAGVISTGGTEGRASFVPDRDATVVVRLLSAGAILLGKTNTPELTLSFETDNLVYGRTNNPYDTDRTPGGSSGGAAAIVAAGGAPFDIGSDYGGSIRLPSHFCGIAGIKPTAGRVPRTGHIYPFGGLQDGFQQVGPLARYVDDLIFLLPLIMGPDWIDPGVFEQPWSDPRAVDLRGLKVAFHTDNGVMTPTTDIVATVKSVAGLLEPAVQAIDERRPDGIERTLDVALPVFNWDGGAAVRRLLRAAGTIRHTLSGFTDAPAVDAVRADELIAEMYAWRSNMLSIFADYDAILCPVNAFPARAHGDSLDELAPFSYTMAFNVAGWPGAVVRAGSSAANMPIGVQIVAAPGREHVALALARFVESETGGFVPPPI